MLERIDFERAAKPLLGMVAHAHKATWVYRIEGFGRAALVVHAKGLQTVWAIYRAVGELGSNMASRPSLFEGLLRHLQHFVHFVLV